VMGPAGDPWGRILLERLERIEYGVLQRYLSIPWARSGAFIRRT
jgi:hypothetical protein